MRSSPFHRVGIAADHGGYELKEYLLTKLLREASAEVIDFGNSQFVADDDYPDFITPLATAVASGEVVRGIAICGSGVGASVCANKIAGVRSALINDSFSAHQGVEDDDMNIICLGGRVVGHALAWEWVQAFLQAQFSGQARHRRRLEKVAQLENRWSPTRTFPHPKPEESPRKPEPVRAVALERWENEGGEIPGQPHLPHPAERHLRSPNDGNSITPNPPRNADVPVGPPLQRLHGSGG